MNPFITSIRFALPLALAIAGRALADEGTNAATPETARDYYNAGTKLLTAKKYADAEKMFVSALALQDERVQPSALYNLGHARFTEGVEIFKKGPDAQKVSAQGNSALAAGDQATRQAESALAQNELSQMVEAYLAGRGARHELREAEKAVQSAMDIFGNTLRKWQRSADDFKSAAELNPADTNAVRNAELADQEIAKLVDLIRKLQQMLDALAGQKSQLGKAMSKLKGQMPGLNAPPGPNGEDDDEDQVQPDSLRGQKENASRDGDQGPLPLSPDQAGQILDAMSIDTGRGLPMGDKGEGKPGEKKGRNW